MKTLKTLLKWTAIVTVTAVAVTFVAAVTVVNPWCGLLLSANLVGVVAVAVG